jgi:predicted cupin superfamily sugar epimerase
MTAFEPHPEGGSYHPVWRSEIDVPGLDRVAASCIAYRLAPGERSRWHRVASTELWLWQGGGDLVLTTGGTGNAPVEPGTSVLLGAGRTLQHVVEPGEWQSAAPAADEPSAEPVTVTCVVVPGFDWRDWEVAG